MVVVVVVVFVVVVVVVVVLRCIASHDRCRAATGAADDFHGPRDRQASRQTGATIHEDTTVIHDEHTDPTHDHECDARHEHDHNHDVATASRPWPRPFQRSKTNADATPWPCHPPALKRSPTLSNRTYMPSLWLR